MVLTAVMTCASGRSPSRSRLAGTVCGIVTAAPSTLRSARMRAMASGSSAAETVRTSQVASIPAAAKPALKKLTAGSPASSPPRGRRRAPALLDAVLLEEAAGLLVWLGASVFDPGGGEAGAV